MAIQGSLSKFSPQSTGKDNPYAGYFSGFAKKRKKSEELNRKVDSYREGFFKIVGADNQQGVLSSLKKRADKGDSLAKARYNSIVGDERIQLPALEASDVVKLSTPESLSKGLVEGVTSSFNRLGRGLGESASQRTALSQEAEAGQAQLSQNLTNLIAKYGRQLRDPKVSNQKKDRIRRSLQGLVRQQADLTGRATERQNEIIEATDPIKGAAAVGNIGFNALTLGTGGGAVKSGASAIARRIASGAGQGAIAGGLSAVEQKGRDTTFRDIAQNAALGGAIGGAVAGVGPVVTQLRKAKGAPTPVIRSPLESEDLASRVNAGRLTNEVTPMPVKTLESRGVYGEVRKSIVDKYVDDIRKGRPIDPLIVDEQGRLLDGNNRLEAFKRLGIKDAPTATELPKPPSPQQLALEGMNTEARQVNQQIAEGAEDLVTLGGNVVKNQSKLATQITETYPHLKNSVQVLTHRVRNQNELSKAASKMVADDSVGARELFSSGSLAQINPDAHVKLGEKLATEAAKQGDTAALNEILANHQAALTSHAQALRAAGSTNILKPDAIVAYAAKKADDSGRKLAPALVSKLEKEAALVAKMADGPEKTLATVALKEMAENPSLAQKSAREVGKVFASFRALLASTDLSGGGRQGGVAFTRFPVIGARAEAAGVKSAFSTKAYKDEIAKLANLADENGTPLSQAFKRMKLSLNALTGKSEEQFSNAALVEGKIAKKLGVGHIIEGSNRAYDVTLSSMRANIAKELIDANGGVDNLMKTWNTAQWRSLGRVIDTITGVGRGGRGLTGKGFEKIAPALSKSLFSARLWKSRLDLLNPLYYAEVANNPVAFRLAVRSGLQFASTVSAVLGAAAAAGAKVETDLRSSDFGKVKIGNTRIDIMGGLQQNLVFFWRELAGEYKSSTTGNISDLKNPGYGGANRFTIAGRTIENKLTPVLSEIIRQIRGVDIGGNKMTGEDRLKSIGSNFVPLSIQDVYSGIKDSGPRGGALALTGFFGAGASTYGPSQVDWSDSESKTLAQFQQKVGPVKFKEANDVFNQDYATWLQNLNENPRYNALSIQDQATVRANKKQQILDDLFKKYNFKYQRPKEDKDRLKNF